MNEGTVRSNLIRARWAMGLSQEALAELVDTTQAYLSQLEHCTRAPGRVLAKRIAKALGYENNDSHLFDEGIVDSVQFSEEAKLHGKAS